MDTKDGSLSALATLDAEERAWKVEINGAVYGPYSLNQVRQYLGEGRVLPESLLQHSRNPELSGRVAEILSALDSDAASNAIVDSSASASTNTQVSESTIVRAIAPEAPSISRSELPERTQEITLALNRPLVEEFRAKEDPATGLFDALQLAKEQKEQKADAKPAQSQTPGTQPTSRTRRGKPQIDAWKEPPKVAALAIFGAIGALSIFVILHLIQQTSKKIETAPQATYKKPEAVATVKAQALPTSLAPVGHPAFKTPPRLVMPVVPAVVHPVQNTADPRDSRDLRDARDERDLRDVRDERDRRDARDERDYQDDRDRDNRDQRDPRYDNSRDSRDLRDSRDSGAPQGQDPRDPRYQQPDPRFPDANGNPDPRYDNRQNGLQGGGTSDGTPARVFPDPNDPRQDPQQ